MKSASFATLAAGVIAGRPTRSYGYDAPQRSYAAQGKEAEYGYDRSYASTEVAPQRGYGYKAPVISKEVGYEGAYGAEAEYDTQVYGDRKGYGSGYGSERSAKGYEYEQGYGKAGYEKPAPKDFYEVSDNKYGYSAPKKTVRVAEKVEYGYGREAGYGVEEKTAPVKRINRGYGYEAPVTKGYGYEAPVEYTTPVVTKKVIGGSIHHGSKGCPIAAAAALAKANAASEKKVVVKSNRLRHGRHGRSTHGYGRNLAGNGHGLFDARAGYKVVGYNGPSATEKSSYGLASRGSRSSIGSLYNVADKTETGYGSGKGRSARSGYKIIGYGGGAHGTGARGYGAGTGAG